MLILNLTKKANVTMPVGISFDDHGCTDSINYYFTASKIVLWDSVGNSPILEGSSKLGYSNDNVPSVIINGDNAELRVIFRKG